MGAREFLKRMQQMQQIQRPRMSLAPNTFARHGLDSGFYTGAGQDGIVQPWMPTEDRTAVNGRRYGVDEGEVVITDNKTVQDYGGPERLDAFIQSNRTRHAMPDGSMMAGPEHPGAVPGSTERYACGGVPTRNRYMGGGVPTRYQDGGIPSTGVPGNIGDPNDRKPVPAALQGQTDELVLDRYANRLAGTQRSERAAEGQRMLQSGFDPKAVSKAQAISDVGRRQQVSDMYGDFATNAAQRAESRRASQQASNENRRRWQDTFDEGNRQWQEQFDFTKQKYGDQEFQRMADDAQIASFESFRQKYPNATQEDYDTAREFKEKQLQGMDVELQTAQERLGQLKDNARWNEAAAFLDAGDFEGYADIVKQITGRDINTSDYQEDRSHLEKMRYYDEHAADVQKQLQDIGLNQTQFDQIYDWVSRDAPLHMVQGKMVEMGISPQAVADTYYKLKTARQNQLDLQNVQIESAEMGLQQDQYAAVQANLQSGMSPENAARTLMEGGMPADQALRVSNEIYQRSVRRGDLLEASTTMLQAGDIQGAQNILSQTYPGITFDFSRLQDEQQRSDFAEGMGIMAQYASLYNNWDDAKAALEAAGVKGLIGSAITGKDGDFSNMAPKLFGQMVIQSNPVTRVTMGWNDEMVRSYFPDDSPLSIDDMRATLGQMVSGMSFDKDGNLISLLSNNTNISVGGDTTNVGTTPSAPQVVETIQDDPRWTDFAAKKGLDTTSIDEAAKVGVANYDEFVTWYHREGFIDAAPDFPVNVPVSPDGVAQYAEFWSDPKLKSLSDDQLRQLISDRPEFMATPLENDASVKPDLKSWWNGNLGRLFEMDGEFYVIAGIENNNQDYKIIDPQTGKKTNLDLKKFDEWRFSRRLQPITEGSSPAAAFRNRNSPPPDDATAGETPPGGGPPAERPAGAPTPGMIYDDRSKPVYGVGGAGGMTGEAPPDYTPSWAKNPAPVYYDGNETPPDDAMAGETPPGGGPTGLSKTRTTQDDPMSWYNRGRQRR